MENKFKTVDEFIDDPWNDENYARWILNHFRLSASLQMAFKDFMKDHLLFCTWEGKRYRVNGASRFGDIWLTKDYTREFGYEHRVCIDSCSNWSDKPCHK